MSAKLDAGLLAIFTIGFLGSAFAQTDGLRFADDLRAKYGPALSRETFMVRPGIEMVVDYAPNGHVCRIQLPPIAPDREPGVISTQAIDDLVTELVPLEVRGKELRRWNMIMGISAAAIVDYENLAIAEALQGATRSGVTITFAKEECH